MNIQDFINSLPAREKKFIQTFRKLILDSDKNVTEELGHIMANKNTLNYTQEKTFKYGLSVTKNHISFHSMVLYSNPKLMDYLKQHLNHVKFQKGCINFNNLDKFPKNILQKHLKVSASVDFTPIINYRKKEKI